MPLDTNVGPIIFANATAREQLISTGTIVTLRKTERTTGETWWRLSRTGEKEGDCTVRFIGKINPQLDILQLWVDESGFDTVEEWQDAIQGLNDQLPESGYLYRVTTPENTDGVDDESDGESEAVADGGHPDPDADADADPSPLGPTLGYVVAHEEVDDPDLPGEMVMKCANCATPEDVEQSESRVPDQDAFGKEVAYPECNFCGEVMRPETIDSIENADPESESEEIER